MTSIIIAAHNEESVIGRTLDTLLQNAAPGELDVIVVPNGCTDRTAEIASERPGVRVITSDQAGKAAALNLGDRAARGYPRIYLDADIAVGVGVVRALRDALGGSPASSGDSGGHAPLAAVPGRRSDIRGRPLLVRGYFAISDRLPSVRDGLYGRGMIALSREGRERFDEFPNLVADDLYLDSQFDPSEKRRVDSVTTTVATPLRTRDLVRRLIRVRRGNDDLRQRADDLGIHVRPSDRLSWLRDVVIPEPILIPAAMAYVTITITAALLARYWRSGNTTWYRDESTRRPSA